MVVQLHRILCKDYKIWSCVTQAGTTSFDDSFNCSGITDEATGRSTLAFSNNMNNALYSLTGCTDANGAVAIYGSANKATSSIQIQTGDAFGIMFNMVWQIIMMQ